MLRMFYFSGTGNARNAARWMVDNTRGGIRLFGVYLPGLSGATQLLTALVFVLKGYRVVGMRPIDLPSSWLSLHPGLREDTIQAIYHRCEAVTRRCANRLLDGRRDLRALFDLPQDLLIAPIALGYYLVGRFFFAKSFFASTACDACGVCINQCPVQAIRSVAGRRRSEPRVRPRAENQRLRQQQRGKADHPPSRRRPLKKCGGHQEPDCRNEPQDARRPANRQPQRGHLRKADSLDKAQQMNESVQREQEHEQQPHDHSPGSPTRHLPACAARDVGPSGSHVTGA